MTTITKFKSTISNWREICQNYIGSLAYYLLFISIALTAIRLYMQLSQYIIYARPSNSLNISNPVSNPTYQPGILENLILYSLSLIMILVTAAVILLIPYLIGYISGKAMRAILNMTSHKLNFKNLFKLKYSLSVLMIIVVLLTIYDYQLTVDANWYGITLLGLGLMALGLFWLQSLLVRLWKIKLNKVY